MRTLVSVGIGRTGKAMVVSLGRQAKSIKRVVPQLVRGAAESGKAVVQVHSTRPTKD